MDPDCLLGHAGGRAVDCRPHCEHLPVLRHVHSLWRTLPLHDNHYEVYADPLHVPLIVLFNRHFPNFSATIAKLLVEDSFALIFGINTLFALFFQTMLTVFVVSGTVTTLVIRQQFVVYGSYFVVLGVIYGCSGLWKICRGHRTKNSTSYDIRE